MTIPIIVGLMVLTIAIGAVLSIKNQQSRAAALPGKAPVSSDTAQPLPTRSIPYPKVPRLSLQETWDKLEQGTAILVDLRGQTSYDKVHAAGAISIPEQEIDARLDELPRSRDWIFYCT